MLLPFLGPPEPRQTLYQVVAIRRLTRSEAAKQHEVAISFVLWREKAKARQLIELAGFLSGHGQI
jgi:hypothetical protein